MKYNPNEIERHWQKYWADNKTFAAQNPTSSPSEVSSAEKPKYYVLDMFPYPSGAGLHVGHPLGYIASDIVARYKRHKGFNVLHPQGYDSFGLPAEQYAIQTGQHPDKTTQENIARYREQLDKIGFSYDWDREVRTSDADYYKHTQWIFIQLFNSWYNKTSDKAENISTLISTFQTNGNINVNAACDDNIQIFDANVWNALSADGQQKILLKYRLTYLAETEVNWCAALGTVLANDEIVNGVSERGGHQVIRKKMMQWSMRISAYADRLLQGLETVDWSESIKETQRNWIGKSVGASISFKIKDTNANIEVFTTRPDTIFGVTFMTLAPEHDLVLQITTAAQKQAVADYKNQTAKRSERERMADVKTISGVFTGAYAQHPFTKEPIPVWVGDYVLAGYGTGAVMAVPCGDDRDYAFAQHFEGQNGMLPIKNIFKNIDISEKAFSSKDGFVLQNSDLLDDLNYKQASKKIIEALEQQGCGFGKINYRLRDAVFSRQRYWGEPFPVYYKNGIPQMIPEECLPIKLPEVEKYLPTEDGQPPLGNAIEWAWNEETLSVVSCDLLVTPSAVEGAHHSKIYPLELNTMPGWAGSSWYWMRYMDAKNPNEIASQEARNYWESVDLYLGGSEHATGHLLYSRFWNKFLKDIGYATTEEPFKKLINQGMILGNSAFVYRTDDSKKLYSKGLEKDFKLQPIHVDLSCINDVTNELNIAKFKENQLYADYKDAEFILENGKYIVGREVEKMSKSKYNVVNPDDICNEYGADTLRLYEMFLGPLEQSKPWNTAGITGVFGFLKKLWKLYFNESGLTVTNIEPSDDALRSLHKTIKKTTEDIENFSFNTSVSQFMICVNELTAQNCHDRAILEPLAILVSPYAPHIAEELWFQLGHKTSISEADFPICNEQYLLESEKEYPVSFNGKMRFTINLPLDLTAEKVEAIIMNDERTVNQLAGATPKKVIFISGKVINIVI
jgi:leucyl-tRNA synthetase